MKKRFVRAAALACSVMLFLSLFSGCYFLPKEEEILEPPLKVPEAVSYKTYEVTKGTIERYMSGSGKFESTETQILYYPTTGRLKEIHVKSGAEVKKGDLIVELDTGDLEYTIYKQEKAVRTAELSLEIAQKNAVPDEIAIRRAEINVELAERELELSRDKLKNTWGDEKKALQESIYKQECNLELLKMTLEQVKQPSDTVEADLERAQINYDLASAQLEVYRKQLEDSRLYAEMDGTVIYVANMEPGDSVSAYYDLVKIADAKSLRITMKADDTSELYVGMEMDITYSKAKNSGTVTGRIVQLTSDVSALAPEAERTAVKIEVDEIPEGTRIGDTVNVNVLLERKDDIITLPLRYVSSYSARRYVRVLNEEGWPEERDVKLGIQSNNVVEIVSGLEAGEVIVI